jgi:hypothetical protein
MAQDSRSTTGSKTRYIGRAHKGTVSFFWGDNDSLLIEKVEDGVSLFLGETQDSPVKVRDKAWDILICLREGLVAVDVPVIGDLRADGPTWFQISIDDLFFAIDKKCVSRSDVRFAPSIMALINIRR